MSEEQSSVLPPELTDPLAQHTLVVPPREESPHLVVPDPVPEIVEEPPQTPKTGRPLDAILAVSVSVLVTAVVAGTAFVYGFKTHSPNVMALAPVPASMPMVTTPESPHPYFDVTLEARAAVVYDIREKRFLFRQNEHSKRSLASLTKIMTGVIASEQARDKERIAIPAYAIETEGDSGLFANETWNLKDLISFVLMTSSNDGADAVATVIGMTEESATSSTPADGINAFVAMMNRQAQDIGLTNTTFTNPTGLDEVGGKYGGEGTAADMAKLIAYAWEQFPETLTGSTELERTYVSEDGFVHKAVNTNKDVYAYPGLLGSKTGYTDYAGGNLAIVYDAGLNHPIAVIVLGSSVDGRFSDVQTLIDATAEYMQSGWYAYEMAGSTPTL